VCREVERGRALNFPQDARVHHHIHRLWGPHPCLATAAELALAISLCDGVCTEHTVARAAMWVTHRVLDDFTHQICVLAHTRRQECNVILRKLPAALCLVACLEPRNKHIARINLSADILVQDCAAVLRFEHPSLAFRTLLAELVGGQVCLVLTLGRPISVLERNRLTLLISAARVRDDGAREEGAPHRTRR